MRYPSPTAQYDQRMMAELIRALEESDQTSLRQVLSGFRVSNYTETRTLNPSTATTADVANFIATIVADVQQRRE